MTDISNWYQTIFIMKYPNRNIWTGEEEEYFVERIMVPLNDYQMGNLIDALSQVENTGDWYGEFCDIVARAMKVAGLKKLCSNRGNTFTIEDIEKRNIKK